ncbi:HD domain-containing phosphohydrolase [Arcobacter sp. LA11]|uniref:HD domain-containing phosphohydrolase n=1 Tax=Arcobacter sp. LA11 TaxID=1898176 RepID=UPI0009332AB9|nr:HD domain-containing phosphohydrolase [Arcobacter sp. LA11]
MFRIRIRPTILFIFSLVVFFAVVMTLGLQYYFSKQLATDMVIKNVKNLSVNTDERLENMDNYSSELISILELSSGIDDLSNKFNSSKILKKMAISMKNKEYIYAIYFGFSNGDFFELINLPNDNSNLKNRFEAKDNERWLGINIINIDNKTTEIKTFFEKDFKISRKIVGTTEYNPTKRPWYINALKSNTLIKTRPYMFANLKSNGITYAKKIPDLNDEVVIGIDISLKNLSNFLKSQIDIEGSYIYLVNDEGKVIVSSTEENKLDKKLTTLLKSLNSEKLNEIEINGNDYFVVQSTINSKFYNKEHLYMLIPRDKIMDPINLKILYAIGLNAIFMSIFTPILWYSSKPIVNPIYELEKENEKIRDRKFDEVKLVKTRIKEVYHLSKSLLTMSDSIKEYQDSQIKLMDSFIALIASAIDSKSEYTGGHCNRVPILTLMLAQAASDNNDGIFKEFKLKNEDEKRELSIAAWLHDCGKITTPEYIVDKATKLETIYNRIHEIRTRFEVIYRDLIIESYKKLEDGEGKPEVAKWLESEQKQLISDFEFIANTNIGSEFMKEEDKNRIVEISKRTWARYFDDTLGLSKDEKLRYKKEDSSIENLLSDKQRHIIKRNNFNEEEYLEKGFKLAVPENMYNLGEVYNLSISKGTLTDEERFKINEHIIMTIKMLEHLPFPEHLKKVPEYAGAHHETLIGTGYPKKLTKEDMSIPARIMAVADIFEALTAKDRPYKDAKTLSESIKILSFMVKDKHIDEDVFKLFLESKVYLDYAKEYLSSEQIDSVDIKKYI